MYARAIAYAVTGARVIASIITASAHHLLVILSEVSEVNAVEGQQRNKRREQSREITLLSR